MTFGYTICNYIPYTNVFEFEQAYRDNLYNLFVA